MPGGLSNLTKLLIADYSMEFNASSAANFCGSAIAFPSSALSVFILTTLAFSAHSSTTFYTSAFIFPASFFFTSISAIFTLTST